MMKKQAPYGCWKSEVSAEMLGGAYRLSDVQFDASGTLLWVEGRSGIGILVAKEGCQAQRDLTTIENVRGGVGYGGGEFNTNNGTVAFAARDGNLYTRNLGHGVPKPILPGFGKCASPQISSDGNWIVYVYSDGQHDLLGIVDSAGVNWPQKLVSGADFYMQPVWHPLNRYLAWVEWDHPNMPWDGSRLCMGSLSTFDRPTMAMPWVEETIIIAGDGKTPVCQPCFSPDGKYLSYIIHDGEWDSLHLYNLETQHTQTLIQGDGYMLARPAWVQGNREYAWSPDGKLIYYLRMEDAFTTLWCVEIQTGQHRQIDVSPYTYLSQLDCSPQDGTLAFIASSPVIPDRIVTWKEQQMVIIRRSSPEMLDPAYFPAHKPISWKGEDAAVIHGLYIPPQNPCYSSEGLPPVIINIHGGPTSQAVARFNGTATYFTSRGYGWLEVNYRGSAGYGRSYQDALNGRWGEVDAHDAISAARALIDQKLADQKRIVIMGGSAGGYTVLNALESDDQVFAAGIDLYGVSDLFALAADTHKFEAHYTDSLVGKLPEAGTLYRQWSPLTNAHKIKVPVAVFQGSEDTVVPQSQSEMIVNALQRNGIPHLYKVYEGEGHGFRMAETIRDYLQETERFLQKYVIFQ